ncbi:MAG: DUF456 domain-containing protein [Pseudomonadota bacterium]
MLSIALIVLGAICVVAGLAGVVFPLLPGSPLILAGLVLVAWAEQFAYVGVGTLGVLVALTLLTFVVDYVASVLGAGRMGASRAGLLGAAIGTFAGVFFFPIGLLLGPFIGAVVGELLTRSDALRAGKVGVGAVIGVFLGAVGNLIIAMSMIGVFLAVRFAA